MRLINWALAGTSLILCLLCLTLLPSEFRAGQLGARGPVQTLHQMAQGGVRPRSGAGTYTVLTGCIDALAHPLAAALPPAMIQRARDGCSHVAAQGGLAVAPILQARVAAMRGQTDVALNQLARSQDLAPHPQFLAQRRLGVLAALSDQDLDQAQGGQLHHLVVREAEGLRRSPAGLQRLAQTYWAYPGLRAPLVQGVAGADPGLRQRFLDQVAQGAPGDRR